MKHIGLAVSLIGLFFVSAYGAKDNIMNIRERKTNEIILSIYLADKAEQLECFFTFERLTAADYASPLNAWTVLGIADELNVADSKSLITKLRRDLKGCTVNQSKTNPRVIHVIETPLLKLKDYVMERKVDITYSGQLGSGRVRGAAGGEEGLIVELAKTVENIGYKKGGDLRTAFDDLVTHVEVKAKQQKVRDVLTNYVPLTNYSRFIWSAETRIVNGKSKTDVQYFGSKASK